MVYLDPEVVKEARDLGLNISKVCENALIEMIKRIKGSSPKNKLENNSTRNTNLLMVDGWGFEPRTSTMPTPQIIPEHVRKPYEKRMENKLEYNLRIKNAEILLTKFKGFMSINSLRD